MVKVFTESDFIPNIYTSYYTKIAKEYKAEDYYIQVSRTVFCPMKNLDGIRVVDLIDATVGDKFGFYQNTLKEYDEFLNDNQELKDFAKKLKAFQNERKNLLICYYSDKDTPEEGIAHLNELLNQKDDYAIELEKTLKEPTERPKILLLCHENLESVYTAKDEQKCSDIKAGEHKKCHRRILAKYLQKLTKIPINEYNVTEKMQNIVNKDYF